MLAVEEGLNEYTKWNLDYTNNPDTGVFHDKRYQFAGARGLTEKYEADSKKTAEEIAAAIKSPRAQQAFRRKALQNAMPFYKGVQDWEAQQTVAEREQQTQATVDGSLETVVAFPNDPAAMENYVDNVTAAIEFEMMNAPPEAVKIAIDAGISKGEAARIGVIAQSDPIAAQKEIEESKRLLPSVKEKLTAENRAAVTDYRARGVAGEVMERFGGEYDTASGIAWIR